MSAPIQVEMLGLDDGRWAAFVEAHPDSTPYHDPAWAMLVAEVYRLRAAALAVVDGGEVVAGVPAVSAPRPLGSARRWVACAFTDVVEPLVRGIEQAELASALDRWRTAHGLDALDVHGSLPAPAVSGTVAVIHRLRIDPGSDVDASFSSATRRNVRAAERIGMAVRRGRSAACIDAYYDLHVRTRRRLGVPAQPRRFFRRLWTSIIEPGHGFLVLVEHEGRPIAGAVFLESCGTVVYKFGASDADAWSLRPNNLLFAHVIRDSARRGAHTIDFGRSDLGDDGLRRFKAGWGAVESPLVYSRLGGQLVDEPGRGARLLSPVLRRSPVFVTQAVGTALYRYAA